MLITQPPDTEQRGNRLRVAIFTQNVTTAQLDEWQPRFGAPLPRELSKKGRN